MKRILFFTCLIACFTVFSQEAVVQIPDPNFKAFLLTEASINQNGDDEIQVSEALNVTELHIQAQDISSLEGIEMFSNLAVLDCSYNQITNLDLSSNFNLNTLVVDSNALNTINIENNLLLTFFSCPGNSLTDLILTNNTALEYLSCEGNQLTNLDLSNNTALTELSCYQNNLTVLNIANGNNAAINNFNAKNNDYLSCIQIDENFTPPAAWEKDDHAEYNTNCHIGEIVSIPDSIFKAYLLGHSSINVNNDLEIQVTEAKAFKGAILLQSEDENIQSLDGIEAFVNITALNCSGKKLVSLDLSNNTKLVTVDCSHNKLTSLTIDNSTALVELNCNDNQLTSLDISKNTLLSSLNCSNNNLENLDISENTVLELLNCDKNNLTMLSLTPNTLLKSLSLANNEVTALDIATNEKLMELNVQNNQLTALDISNNAMCRKLLCNDNSLNALNIANGNNVAINEFNAKNNAQLTCIQIDENFTPPTTWEKDDHASYETNCPCCVNVEKHHYVDFQLYPNPVNSSMHIDCQDDISSIRIYSLQGVLVLSANKTKDLDVSSLSSGIYLVEIITNNQQKSMQKFIKQ